jgi:hypothetical protein
MTTAGPNWYPDPHNSAFQRWWTGQAWSEQTRPIALPLPNWPSPYANAGVAPAQLSKEQLRAQRRATGPRYGGPAFAFVTILGIVFSVQGIRWARQLERDGRKPTGFGWNVAGIVIASFAVLYQVGFDLLIILENHLLSR